MVSTSTCGPPVVPVPVRVNAPLARLTGLQEASPLTPEPKFISSLTIAFQPKASMDPDSPNPGWAVLPSGSGCSVSHQYSVRSLKLIWVSTEGSTAVGSMQALNNVGRSSWSRCPDSKVGVTASPSTVKANANRSEPAAG